MNELKYCKFCDKEKPVKDFCKSGFFIKNICRECHNKKQVQIYKNSKEADRLRRENKQLKEELEWAIGIVEHNRIISEKNKEIHQLKDNWSMLKEHLTNRYNNGTESISYRQVFIEIRESMQALEIQQKLEQGSNSND